MGIISQKLEEYTKQRGISLTGDMLDQFELYSDVMIEWNSRINLTTIIQPHEIAIKHFLDSLLTINAVDIPSGASLIDVGTGAGFPGIPLKIVIPDLRLTLLDSLNKRTVFLKELSSALKQENIIIHGRAEVSGRSTQMRERFDFATARAVAALPALCEYCMPFVKVGGIFAALKGPDVELEAEDAAKAINEFGGKLLDIKHFDLPYDNKRSIVVIKKISQMPSKYPRIAVKITKKPL